MLRLAALFLLAAAEDWIVLFNGRDSSAWRTPISPAFPHESWRIENGAIYPVESGRNIDLWSSTSHKDFELEFEFHLAPGANGGLKYLVQDGGAWIRRNNRWFSARGQEVQPGDLYVEGTAGLEFQIVDDSTEEARDPKRRAGALYSLIAPVDPPPIGPGVIHRGRIVVQGNHIEHHLDGKKVLQVTLGSPEMEAAWDACKRGDIRSLRALRKREGPIAITHHGSKVLYRNIRIRSLP